MGRAFEYRKAAKEKRWGKMSRIFPKLGKAITIAAKAGGPNPDTNGMLRMAIVNAKAENMPKDNIDAAIKRSYAKDEKNLEEVVYEGYGPHGIAIMIECLSDNTTRTVANVRALLNRAGGSLGKSGSVDYVFTRRGVFHIPKDTGDLEELELELIDFGLEEIIQEEDETVLLVPFESFGEMQKGLEAKGIQVLKAELTRFPNSVTQLTPEQVTEVETLLEKLEDDEDVQDVYHNMA